MILLNKAKDQEYKEILENEKYVKSSVNYNCLLQNQNNVSLQSNNNTSNKNEISLIEENVPIDVIKISNQIMKDIEITEKYSEYFADKFSGNCYKNFLNNLIGYNYNKTNLENILKDIKIKQKIENMNLPNNILDSNNKLNNNAKNLSFENEHKNECKIDQDIMNNYGHKNYDANYENKNLDGKNKENKVLFYENNPKTFKPNSDIKDNDHYYGKSLKNNQINQNNTLFNKVDSNYNYNSDLISIKTKNTHLIPRDYGKTTTSRKKNSGRKRSLGRNSSFDLATNKINYESVNYENPKFENLLRSYKSSKDKSNKKKNKPFNRFTKAYGNLFEKNIFKKNILSNTSAEYEMNPSKQ